VVSLVLKPIFVSYKYGTVYIQPFPVILANFSFLYSTFSFIIYHFLTQQASSVLKHRRGIVIKQYGTYVGKIIFSSDLEKKKWMPSVYCYKLLKGLID
jgi:hypothetical protein